MSCHSSFSLVICFVRLPYYNSCGQQSVILFFSVLHWYFSFSLSFPVVLVLIHSEGPSDEMCIKAKMYSNIFGRPCSGSETSWREMPPCVPPCVVVQYRLAGWLTRHFLFPLDGGQGNERSSTGGGTY